MTMSMISLWIVGQRLRDRIHQVQLTFPIYGPGAFDTAAMTRRRRGRLRGEAEPSGTALLYATFLGGRIDDEGEGIAVDGAGNAYVTGRTYSTNFPDHGRAPTTRAHNGGGRRLRGEAEPSRQRARLRHFPRRQRLGLRRWHRRGRRGQRLRDRIHRVH